MCTGKCARLIGLTLIPMSFACIISNLLLLFPDGKKLPYDQITIQAWLMGGIIGGGLFILCPGCSAIRAGGKGCCGAGCCGNRCRMLNSVFSSAFGVVGGLYCLSVASIRTSMMAPNARLLKTHGSTPFLESKNIHSVYNTVESTVRSQHECSAPNNIVLWNIVLFSILLILGIMEVVLCGIQVINGCFGCVCGDCRKRGQDDVSLLMLSAN
uniref:Transmembrane 4 L six family member 5 n=1 Tax=Erpetoichthys calabaricus TaxID=27687 RepID=A0A8C4S3C1_ERPCA